MQTRSLTRTPFTLGRIGLVFGLTLALTACEESGEFSLFNPKTADGASDAPAVAASGKTVERDVEAPEVFQVSEAGLWDGRPSLGGVWAAHPDVKEPERVILRNAANNKFVVGALFRRERENPGPRLQISSDAAEALGMLAGQPMELNVTALRKEQVAVEGEGQGLSEPEFVEETSLDPIKSAAAAIEAADTPAAATPAVTPKPATPKKSSLSKPYVQLGIFSVEKNANNTATAMRTAGMIPTVKKQSLNGKTFWRVIVGPAQNKSELNQLIKRVKASGFTDAYAVTN
ncbi:SPOR domain-containing protein [Lentibacter algarum]|uniref:SPOR domain-containing protein n=1 Tax=Lentibacter algarum TaxID=576131 RepID=UPI001C0703E6|nr:SPOR domain-containing protein [Lentibacter algarum]MBU2981719.1 SPOR domain-containing protein [Lentibacter algarum]